MDSSTEIESSNPSKDFRLFMKEKLPSQIVLYLTACGFDSENAFLSFDTSGSDSDSLKQIVQTLRDNSRIMKENIPEAKDMYGMFYNCPQSFFILPGHRSQIIRFVTEVQQTFRKSRTVTKHSLEPELKRWQHDFCRRCQYAKSSSLGSIDPQFSPDDIPKILEHLRHTVATYIRTNEEYQNMLIEDGKQYSIHVSLAVNSNKDACICRRLCATITCHVCGTKLKLPVIRAKFRPANFYRHIKSCIFNKKGREKKPPFNVPTFVITQVQSNVMDHCEDPSSAEDCVVECYEYESQDKHLQDEHNYGSSQDSSKLTWPSVTKTNSSLEIGIVHMVSGDICLNADADQKNFLTGREKDIKKIPQIQ